MFGPMNIKFFFEEFVYCRIERKWKAWWLADTQNPIKIKTFGAF
jgi:hypothetical protein